MPASPSDRRVWLALGAAAIVLLGGCAGGPDDVSTEPAVSLPPAGSGTASAPPGAQTPSAPGTSPGHDATDATSDADDSTVPPGTRVVLDAAAEVEVEDQAGDGRSALVEEVRIGARPGFVVISDAGQTVLGWAYVPSAARSLSVELTTPVQASRELVASLFRDDDGDRKFDPTADPLIVEIDDDGTEPVSDDFDYVLR